MRAATIVFIKETINKNDNYGKFIYFEMIESILKIYLNIIYSSEHTKWKHRIFDTVHFILVFIMWEGYDSRSSVYGYVVFMARSDVGSV